MMAWGLRGGQVRHLIAFHPIMGTPPELPRAWRVSSPKGGSQTKLAQWDRTIKIPKHSGTDRWTRPKHLPFLTHVPWSSAWWIQGCHFFLSIRVSNGMQSMKNVYCSWFDEYLSLIDWFLSASEIDENSSCQCRGHNWGTQPEFCQTKTSWGWPTFLIFVFFFFNFDQGHFLPTFLIFVFFHFWHRHHF